MRQLPSLGKVHKIAVLKTVGWYPLFKQSWNKSVILFARIGQVFLIIKSGALSTPRYLLHACNIASSTSLLEHVYHFVIQSLDSMSNSARPVVELFLKIFEVGLRMACFNASLFPLLDVASSPSVF